MNARVLDRPLVAELPAARAVFIVTAYVAAFFVVLPALLWSLGGAWDARLRLPPLPMRPLVTALGAMLSMAGVWGMSSSILSFWRLGRGLPMSHLPPRRLVQAELYRLTRHPLYMSYTFALAGAGLMAASIGRGLLMPAALTVAWIVYAIAFEEPRLLARHGEAWLAYRRATPLLLVPEDAWRRIGSPLWSVTQPALQWLADRPVLIRVGPTVWVTYGAVAGVLCSVTLMMIAGLLAEILPPDRIHAYAIGLAVAIIGGSRLVWLAYQRRALYASPLATLRTPGFVSWGGYAGLIGFSLLFAWTNGVSLLDMLDRAFLPAVACGGLSRLGCLTYGCCYGRAAAWGICWRRPETKTVRERGADGALPRIPTPVFAGLMALSVFAVLAAATTRHPPAGFVTGLGLFLYGIGRFGVDAFRDETRYTAAQLTAGQIGSAIAVGSGILLMLAVPNAPGWPRAVGAAAFRPVLDVGLLAALGLLSFVAYGFHWKRVGRW
jgi:prolipoprotein diacylglyceryltransferase/protein-S-isoprenylcysteine O-methyltransferase Ste14